MGAADVIAMIEQLPPQEQQQVRMFLEKKPGARVADDVPRMDATKAEAIGVRVFERHPELFCRLAQ